MTINSSSMQKLMIAVNECIEWGQVFILDCLANYVPTNAEEAEMIVERITSRLAHINPSVVFSTIKVLVIYLDYIRNPELIRTITKKMVQPLGT